MRQTLVTMCFFAVITGVGGGSVRDLMIGAPVFWMHDRWVALVCLVAAVVLGHAQPLVAGRRARLGRRGGPWHLCGDRHGQGAGLWHPPVPAFIMGVITGRAGGVIRDVVAGRPRSSCAPNSM
jgi:uncharacterized membrane protein YeiH